MQLMKLELCFVPPESSAALLLPALIFATHDDHVSFASLASCFFCHWLITGPRFSAKTVYLMFLLYLFDVHQNRSYILCTRCTLCSDYSTSAQCYCIFTGSASVSFLLISVWFEPHLFLWDEQLHEPCSWLSRQTPPICQTFPPIEFNPIRWVRSCSNNLSKPGSLLLLLMW